jgi:hypothetical protein
MTAAPGSFEWLVEQSEEQRVRFLGGKTKAALFDAGMLNREDYFKPLKDIDLTGIMVPDRKAMAHSIAGEYKKPSRGRPGGRLAGGGHTDAALREMDRRGIAYNIVRTAANGVRFGNVPDHKDRFKRSGEHQTWFPQSWTEHDIRTAGIVVANKGSIIDHSTKEAVYNGVNVRIKTIGEHIETIHPSYDQP